MFTRKDNICFLVAGGLIVTGFIIMSMDPVANGFGVLTLWIAPPLLLTGFGMPVLGIIGVDNLRPLIAITNPAQRLCGRLSFLAALVVYCLSVEPTASLWDCSEFIACAYKLQVPHTPGTPMALLIGRIFTFFSFGDVFKVALTLNFMSALFSALAVYLVYQIIFYLGRQWFPSDAKSDMMLALSACGGSLCLAFSDTFWFSAVEAETYGVACFFLLLLVWLIITGKDLARPFKDRRLVLIAYLAGLAYCVHPMCLLALPVLPLAWYNRDKRSTLAGVLFCIAGGLLVVFLINRFVAIGLFELAFSFDLFFVNKFHLPFYSGVLMLTLLSAILFRVTFSKVPAARRYLWSLLFLILGFVPYLLLFVRSNHNPPIDEFNPENLALIKAYMNRESYPSSPLLYGPYFDARIHDVGEKKKIFYKDNDSYTFAGTLPEYEYDARQTLLPRMYSNEAQDIETYRSWTGLGKNEKPNFYHNLKFMLSYQLGHMYLRYLMWNFSGRAGDMQDSAWLRPWERLAGNRFEKARNQYWMIPLLVGLIGAVFQFRRDRKGFLSVAVFFLITGVVLALYLNAPPNEPRERDYIYVGSFIAFCFWIGMGILAMAKRLIRFRWGRPALALFGLAIPLWMLYQNYDDHNRSGRTLQVDNARNVLRSCAPNSILFTGGDNDTFPLWYVQEVEGFRTDVRVMVLSYLHSDWYINQLRKSYYDSGAFKLTLSEKDYRQYGPNDVLYVEEALKETIDVTQYLRLLQEEHPALTRLSRNGEPYHILPSRDLRVVVGNRSSAHEVNDTSVPGASAVMFSITQGYVGKNFLAILDLLVSNGWERPIYFNFTSLNALGVDITPYVVQEGSLFRLGGEKNRRGNIAVDTGLAYENLVVTADYSNVMDSSVYFSYEDHFARMIVPLRQSFNDLAAAFLEEGDEKMALKVLAQARQRLYPEHLPPSYTNLQAAEISLALGENIQAAGFSLLVFDHYYDGMRADRAEGIRLSRLDTYLLKRSAELLAEAGNTEYIDKLTDLRIQGF